MTLLTSLQPVRQHSSSTLWRSSFSELKTDVWWLSVNPERLLDLDSPGRRAKSSSTTAHGQPNTSALLLCLLKKATHQEAYLLMSIFTAFQSCLMGVWRSWMPPKTMKGFTTALRRMTEERPTALAISLSQVSACICVHLNRVKIPQPRIIFKCIYNILLLRGYQHHSSTWGHWG